MKVLDAEFVKGFMRMADDGWLQGWHERKGGNLSYRMKAEEVESVKEELCPGEWRTIGTTVPKLSGEYFLVTGSGKYFRSRSGKLVCQYHYRQVAQTSVAMSHKLLTLHRASFGIDYHLSTLEKLVCYLCCCMQIATTVVLQVDDETFHALFLQILH